MESLKQLLTRADFAEGDLWRRVTLSEGEVVIDKGARSGKVYLVLAGRLRIVGDIEVGQHRHIHPGFRELGAGELFGELGMFDGRPHSASVVAIGDSELAEMDAERLLRYLDEHPDIGYGVLKEIIGMLADRLRHTTEQAFSLFAWGLRAHDIDRHL